MRVWAHILDNTIILAHTQFHADLMDLLCPHSDSLKRLPPAVILIEAVLGTFLHRLRIPAPSRPRNPRRDSMESPHRTDMRALPVPGVPMPNLQHLIIDHGAELSPREFWDDYEELLLPGTCTIPRRSSSKSKPILVCSRCVPRFSDAPLPLRPPSAASHDLRYQMRPVGRRLTQSGLETNKYSNNAAAALDRLVIRRKSRAAGERERGRFVRAQAGMRSSGLSSRPAPDDEIVVCQWRGNGGGTNASGSILRAFVFPFPFPVRTDSGSHIFLHD
ncbi:hypothetical protein DFH07DRAFT_967153 [Mycena maculata]|uniref:Uncharacterized protein n=1 Tax=Mycena maculata TaxID=230809 RepID=A0AAD7I6L7_9AGAR|nr:hypothetical protein DFH07DRAFT_967153 [Mycena maculata]